MKDKEAFASGFCRLLINCDSRFSDLMFMRYYDREDGEYVEVKYIDGHSIFVDVTADSITAMCRDITRAID